MHHSLAAALSSLTLCAAICSAKSCTHPKIFSCVCVCCAHGLLHSVRERKSTMQSSQKDIPVDAPSEVDPQFCARCPTRCGDITRLYLIRYTTLAN